jgi:RNA-binding protein 5/10
MKYSRNGLTISTSIIQKNFKAANHQEIARQKAVAACQAADSKVPEQPKYRDRASERPIMHNQPDVPLPENAGSVVDKKRRHAEGPPPPLSPPAVNPGQDDTNIGSKLLKNGVEGRFWAGHWR